MSKSIIDPKFQRQVDEAVKRVKAKEDTQAVAALKLLLSSSQNNSVPPLFNQLNQQQAQQHAPNSGPRK